MKAGIAGAGIAGRLLAFELLKAGWSVSLFDQESQMLMNNCSMAAAGLLTPVTELEKCDALIFILGSEALNKHWPRMLKELNALDGFQHNGSLVIAHPQDSVELQRFTQMIDERCSTQENYQQLKRAEILALEPELTKWEHAFYFAEEGCLNNQWVMEKLGDYLVKKGTQCYFNEYIVDVSPFNITTRKANYQFDLVFDCRGVGAKNIFADVRGVRGELIYLYAPDVNISRPIRLLNPRYNLYLAPKKNNHYILGASEIESEDMSEISVRTTLELLSSAYYLHSGFLEARIIKTMTQCRPTLANHLPKIKYTAGLVALNGLYRHGFLIVPSLVTDIMRFLKKGFLSVNYPEIWERINV